MPRPSLFSMFSTGRQLFSSKRSLLDLTLGRSVSTRWLSSNSNNSNNSKKQVTTVDLSIRHNNFRDVVEQKLTFVDKSLLIKKFLDDKGTQVSLITRPRRFGKTFNLSMLQHFFAAEVNGKPTRDLFAGLNIMQQGQPYLEHQGKYPVVLLSFRSLKGGEFTSVQADLRSLLSRAYAEHVVLLDSPKVDSQRKKDFETILEGKAEEIQIKSSLRDLTACLYQHYGQKTIVLIDDCDTPIQSGYIHGYYDKIVEMMESLFSQGLKGNPYLYRAILTGILRIPKETSLLAGFNNLVVYSVLNSKYGEYFGFTEAEVNTLFVEANLENAPEQIKEWYNGYKIGTHVIYNPWSVINCISEKGLLQPYWVDTSDNTLVKELLVQSNTRFKQEFEFLLEGKTVEKFIDENFVFSDLKGDESAVWSLLLMTGYLKVASSQQTSQGTLCQLQIPNQEVRDLYRKIIEQWLSNGGSAPILVKSTHKF